MNFHGYELKKTDKGKDIYNEKIYANFHMGRKKTAKIVS